MAALAGLAACGGASTGPDVGEQFMLDPITFTVNDNRLTFDPDAPDDLVELNGVNVSRSTDPRVGDGSSAARVLRGSTGYLTARANRVQTFAFYTAGDQFSARGNYGGIYGRTTPYTLAADTSASLTGRYAGMLIRDLGQSGVQGVHSTVSGDVELDIDLEGDGIDAMITNRIESRVGAPSRTLNLSDLTITDANVANNGVFVGSLSGASTQVRSPLSDFAFLTTRPSNGVFEGVVGGRDGDDPEVTGVLGLEHLNTLGVTLYSERGVFYAE
ncbi:hypothetical protein [Yoonia sp. 208BN28-4]|uniref:hypothetical protein n=1 Tax=Yoonia sp. 208BN28-4 TaxID=3126505 RepID=UPI0030B04AF2